MMRRIFIFICIYVFVIPAVYGNTEEAENAYMKGDYQKAAALYETALEKGVSADLYYNLGNAYYRMNNLGKAVLNYERAKILAPQDEDININLEICRSKITDQPTKPSEMFFVTWMKGIAERYTCDRWGYWGVIAFVLSFVFWGLYRYGQRMLYCKIGFSCWVLCALLVIFFNVAAAWNFVKYRNDRRYVLMEESPLYANDRGNSEVLRVLSPGVVLEVIRETTKGWYEVELSNGKVAWLEKGTLEKITM